MKPSILGNAPLTSRARFVTGSLAATAVAASGIPARAAAHPLRVAYFPGVSALPLLTAVRAGFFEREGLAVTASATASSAELFAQLDAGTLDVAHTSIDNPIAYDAGVGAVPVTHHDFAAFIGIDDGLLRLVARPEIRRIDDLRGKTLAVDALATGYAFALRALVSAAGLLDADVTLVARGGTQQRAAGLLAGAFDATLLTPPFDLVANERGFVTLARVTERLGAYQGISAVARRAWLAANRDVAIRYARAYRAALAHAAAHRDAAVALLASELAVPTTIAEGSYDAAFVPGAGFERDAAVDPAGVRTVLRLRARYAPPGAGDDPAAYVNATILAASRS